MLEARLLVEPTNGVKTCALVAAKNSVLAFRKLMRWDDPSWTSAQPPAEHRTAHNIWVQFEQLMNGCIDHIVPNADAAMIDLILGAYCDFAAPLRASLALAVAQSFATPTVHPELERRLRRQLADDPILKYIYEHGCRKERK